MGCEEAEVISWEMLKTAVAVERTFLGTSALSQFEFIWGVDAVPLRGVFDLLVVSLFGESHILM